jgi:hypothetical protein
MLGLTYGTRHREDLATLLHGELRRDQRPAAFGRLYHHRPHREPGDDTVPPGEMKLEGRRPRRKLAQERAGPRDLTREPAMPGGIDAIDAGSHDGEGPAAAVEGAAMGGTVDAGGEPADDRQPGLGQAPRQIGGDTTPVFACAAGTDDRDGRVVGRVERAADEQRERRVGDRPEARRIGRVVTRDDRRAQRGQRLELTDRAPAGRREARDDVGLQTRRRQDGRCGREDGLGAAEPGREIEGRSRREPLDQRERHPCVVVGGGRGCAGHRKDRGGYYRPPGDAT